MFAHENDFDPIVDQAAAAWSVDGSLIKAVIGAESEFSVTAFRAEPAINDASYGLMQLLYQTARLLGYTGSAAGLYDPTVNIRLGTRYLSDLIKTARDRGYGVDSAISAYNAGFSAVRPGDGKRLTNAPGSDFINQAYVDRVLAYADYFRHGIPQLDTVVVTGQTPADNSYLWEFLTLVGPLFYLLYSLKYHR